MSLHTFSRSRAAMQTIEEVAALIEEACRKASTAMADIPEPLRSEGLAELVENVQKWLLPLGAVAPNAAAKPPSPGVEPLPASLPTPTQALMQLLRASPTGLTLKQILAGLDGKFHSVSKNPDNIMYGTLKRLRESGVIANVAGLYKIMPTAQAELAAKPDGPVQKFLEGTILQRVRDFFEAREYAAATVEEIAEATETPEASLRHLFNTRYPHHFKSEKIQGNLNRWYLVPERPPVE